MINNLIFWGVRGSFPISSKELTLYGGNTSCISLQLDEQTLLVIDAGSGFRNLGDTIIDTYKKNPPEIHVLISHFMWDHIMGIPFFKPLDLHGAKINFYSAKREDHFSLKEIFTVQHSRDYFHIDFVELSAHISFYSINAYKPFKIKNATITPIILNHADITFGYIIEIFDKKIAYLCDTAPFNTAFLGTLPDKRYNEQKFLNYIETRLTELVNGSNIVYVDAHFTENEYKDKHHWGHSSPEYMVKLCNKCNVTNLFLGHHAPEHNDDFINQMVENAKALNQNSKMRIFGAKENMTIKIVNDKN